MLENDRIIELKNDQSLRRMLQISALCNNASIVETIVNDSASKKKVRSPKREQEGPEEGQQEEEQVTANQVLWELKVIRQRVHWWLWLPKWALHQQDSRNYMIEAEFPFDSNENACPL